MEREFINYDGDVWMTEKRFKLRLSKLGNGMITDTQKRKHLYFDKKFLDVTLPKTYELLNELADENEELKQQKDKWKQQCIHFKEMLDDMDITYLCDEWIYEELKGDVEWLYVVVVLVSKVMVGVVGGISLQVEMCIVLIIKGNGSIRVSDV